MPLPCPPQIIVISAIASREGLDKLTSLHPEVDVFVAAVDASLSESGMILPGIGDAGDRQFGTPFEEAADVVPVEFDQLSSPSKKRPKK